MFLTAALALSLGTMPAAAQQPALTVIHVGGVLSDDMTPVFFAQKAGLFRREGLDAQIVGASSGTAMAAAVLSGTYEFGKSSLLAAVNAHIRNLPLTVIAAGAVYDSKAPFAQLCVASDSTLSSGKDFENKTIGTPALNDLNQLVISAWVDAHGGNPKTLKFVELPQSTTAPALAGHRVDGSIMLQPMLADAVATKEVKALSPAYDAIAPSFVFAAYFTSADYAKAHPDIVAKFTRVLYESAAYTNKHHAETAALMADVDKIPLPVIQQMPRVDGATALNPAQFEPVIDAAAKFGLIPHGFPAREMLASAPGLK
jgi:ABC-type nitrate/sulfonate/bicarbonate transport system substrate-binding protein